MAAMPSCCAHRSRVDLLILDDWGPEALTPISAAICSRSSRTATTARSIIITSQVPVDRWYDMIGNPTLADAILDRLVHNAYRIDLTGESLRKRRTTSPK